MMTLEQWLVQLLSCEELDPESPSHAEDLTVFSDWLEENGHDVLAAVFRHAVDRGWELVDRLPNGTLVFGEEDNSPDYAVFHHYEGGGPSKFRTVVREAPDDDQCDHCGNTGGCDCGGGRYEDFEFDDDWVEREFPALRESSPRADESEGEDIPF